MSEHPIVAETEAMVAADNAMVNEALAKWEKARAELVILSAKVKDIMDTTTTREPRKTLLSDEVMTGALDEALIANGESDPTGASWLGAETVRAFYENLITSGELRVVKTAKGKRVGNVWHCECGDKVRNLHSSKPSGYCPGCGARIIP